jgi:hypothetical protein
MTPKIIIEVHGVFDNRAEAAASLREIATQVENGRIVGSPRKNANPVVIIIEDETEKEHEDDLAELQKTATVGPEKFLGLLSKFGRGVK